MQKHRFEINNKTSDNNKWLYNINCDVYLQCVGHINSFGSIFQEMYHPCVGTFYLDLRNEKIFEKITQFVEYN
jgi:hypothetical protein